MRSLRVTLPGLVVALAASASAAEPGRLNAPLDVGPDFADSSNAVFAAGDVAAFDPTTGAGTLHECLDCELARRPHGRGARDDREHDQPGAETRGEVDCLVLCGPGRRRRVGGEQDGLDVRHA